MYIKRSVDYKVLNHLNALEEEFETLWIDINTGPKSKNIIVCCAYRHPDTDASKFAVYLESTLSKIDKNKLFVLWGTSMLTFLIMNPIATLMNYKFYGLSSSTPPYSPAY